MRARHLFTSSLLAAVGLLLVTGLGAEAVAIAPPPPERTGIVFENGGRIVSMKADGSGRKVLTRKKQAPVSNPWDVGHDSDPEVSANGESLLFLRTQFGKDRQQIIVSDREGRGQRVVYSSRISPSRSKWVELYSPIFTLDDGIMVVRSELVDGKQGNYVQESIVSMNRNGGERKVRRWARHAEISSIDLSPNGKKLLISGSSPREEQRIEVLDLKSGRSRVLFKGGDEARFSPDGSQIVFDSEHEQLGKECDFMDGCFYDSRIYLMNADGSDVRRLIKGKARGFQLGPDFSPDGSRIVFYGDRNTAPLETTSSEIYSVGVDGSCLTWLTNGSPASTSPVWAPDAGTSYPARCGGADRQPLVEMKPGSSAPYWLGPTFGTAMFYADGGKGRGFELDEKDPFGFRETGMNYNGCTEYSSKDCDDVEYVVGYAGVCRKWPQGMLNSGRFGLLTVRRGALVMWPRPVKFGGQRYLSQVLVFTGGHQLSLDAIASAMKPGKVYGRMVGALRPVGTGERPGSLPHPVVSRSLARKAARIAWAVDNRVSRARVAKRFGIKPRAVRSWAGFHHALVTLKALGPIRERRCPDPE